MTSERAVDARRTEATARMRSIHERIFEHVGEDYPLLDMLIELEEAVRQTTIAWDGLPVTPAPREDGWEELRRAAKWLVSIHADDIAIPKGSALWEDLQSLKVALAAARGEPGLTCVYCEQAIAYRPSDPVMHVGCGIAESADEAFEIDRWRAIETAAREAVDAAGTNNWPVNCDRLRVALAIPTTPEPDPGTATGEGTA